MRRIPFLTALLLLASCASVQPSATTPDGTTIYVAREIVTMARPGEVARAVAVRDSAIVGTGSAASLSRQYPGATVDRRFANNVIVPGLIDPHMHVVLSSLLYAQPAAPPWPIATPEGMSPSYPTPEAFLARLREIVAAAPSDTSPVIVYGYHNLIQGEIDRHVLDRVTSERPLIVWQYSGHDFYLNTRAIELVGATPSLAQRYHGIGLAPDGSLNGRIYEDAAFLVVQRLGPVLFSRESVERGSGRYFDVVRNAGVTTTADLAYGVFGLRAEDAAIRQAWSFERDGFRLYLVPEFRAFEREFGGAQGAARAVVEMAQGQRQAAAPVLPRVKFFADAAFYSQTMRLSPPGYLAGQSRGTEGVWVTEPDRIDDVIRPYFEAGLAAHIHSNGDAAQTATLQALATLRQESFSEDFVIEHGGLFSPDQVRRAGELDAMASVASHYAFYMGQAYAEALGEPREHWITPVGSLSRAGTVLALHSDAPLAPPEPLRAAGVQIERATREGGVYERQEALTRYDALEAITLDAARVLGLEDQLGSIEPGKRADFTILNANPLRTQGSGWADIGVWGVVIDGEPRPLERR
jgi:predicted amidohydrolase YtcJ